jgi:putative restriction endonuclease
MPAISPNRLVSAIISAVQDSGYSAVLLNSPRQHPRKFAVQFDDGNYRVVWVYAWTLTHGGRPSLANEYRIQMTTVSSPLAINPDGPTVLIGYEPDLELFAGFDLDRHKVFTTGSPSIQIDIRTVRKSLQDGMAFDRKSNDEIAIGFRPDQFVNYVRESGTLHRLGRQSGTFRLLAKASSLEDIQETELENLTSKPRRQIVQKVVKLARDANFRQQIMYAYGNRCAATRAQLKLVEAAHILPVGAPGSVDVVANGIALSPTYHRAYDHGLIYLTEHYEMRVNESKVAELMSIGRSGGLDTFRASLGQILLPPDRTQWPRKDFIREANRFRQIPS